MTSTMQNDTKNVYIFIVKYGFDSLAYFALYFIQNYYIIIS